MKTRTKVVHKNISQDYNKVKLQIMKICIMNMRLHKILKSDLQISLLGHTSLNAKFVTIAFTYNLP